MTLVNPLIDEEAAREIARRLEAEHPLWIVVFGVYTQQFVCLPKFEAPGVTILVAAYPDALPDRMRRAEEAVRQTHPSTGTPRLFPGIPALPATQPEQPRRAVNALMLDPISLRPPPRKKTLGAEVIRHWSHMRPFLRTSWRRQL